MPVPVSEVSVRARTTSLRKYPGIQAARALARSGLPMSTKSLMTTPFYNDPSVQVDLLADCTTQASLHIAQLIAHVGMTISLRYVPLRAPCGAHSAVDLVSLLQSHESLKDTGCRVFWACAADVEPSMPMLDYTRDHVS
jgi:hypothetical protein